MTGFPDWAFLVIGGAFELLGAASVLFRRRLRDNLAAALRARGSDTDPDRVVTVNVVAFIVGGVVAFLIYAWITR